MNTRIFDTLPNFFSPIISRFTASFLALEPNTLAQYENTPLRACIDGLYSVYSEFAEQLTSSTERVESTRQHLERFGVWREYATRTAGNSVENALTTLGGMARSYGEAEAALMRHGELPQSIVARSAWFWFEQKYGHRALGEGDIAVPRFADDRALTFQDALKRPMVRSYDDEFGDTAPLSLKARFCTGLWRKYQEAVQDHEGIRSAAMLSVYALRKDVITSVEYLIQRNVIETKETLWEMSIDEMLKL
jgi:hypothetical protein